MKKRKHTQMKQYETAILKMRESGKTREEMGQQVHKYENLLHRQFQAVKPNSKWVTDISYIHFYNHERIRLKTGVAPLKISYFLHWVFCAVGTIWSTASSAGFFICK